jgi:hypothetical protein
LVVVVSFGSCGASPAYVLETIPYVVSWAFIVNIPSLWENEILLPASMVLTAYVL